MENNKEYYTPSMDEFKIGMFYQWESGGNWYDSEITDFDAPMIDSTDGGEHNFEYALSDGRIRVRFINEDDFKDINCTVIYEKCPFYGTKVVYILDGEKQSESNMSDGFDTTYAIEQDKYNMFRVKRIDVGGFAGGETSEQIFYGRIRNKSELISTLKQLRCPLKIKENGSTTQD